MKKKTARDVYGSPLDIGDEVIFHEEDLDHANEVWIISDLEECPGEFPGEEEKGNYTFCVHLVDREGNPYPSSTFPWSWLLEKVT